MHDTFFLPDLFTPPPIGERSIVKSVCVCVCVCVCVRVCLSAIISSELHVRSSPFFLHVTYGRGSLFWWCSDMLRISGFVDRVIFARKRLVTLLNV